MNYKPEQNPKYVNQRILDYIDTVMHPQCITQADKWTIESMVSWKRFGSTICHKCSENRERLHMMVNGFKDEYDAHVKGTMWLDRKTTPYSDVPYSVRGTCEAALMDFEFDIYRRCNGVVFLPGNTVWTPDLLYTAGSTVFRERLSFKNALSRDFIKKINALNLKINNDVKSWNLNVLQHKNTALEAKLVALKTQIQQPETKYSLKKCPYV